MPAFGKVGVPVVSVFVAFCLLVSYGQLNAGHWWDSSPQGNGSKSVPNATSSTSPVEYETTPSAWVYNYYPAGGRCGASAYVRIDTYGTWMGKYDYSTGAVKASFSGERRMTHNGGSPSHSGIQGTWHASWKVRVSFNASCSVRTNAMATCGGAASASGSILGNEGNKSIEAINVGCTTANGGYPIGFNVGGSVGGTGGSLGVQGATNHGSIYESGLIFRDYIATTLERPTGGTMLKLLYSGSVSASAACTATPGWTHSSEARAYITTEAEVSDVTIDVWCPPPQG